MGVAWSVPQHPLWMARATDRSRSSSATALPEGAGSAAADPAGPARADTLLVRVGVRTDTERRLVTDWAALHHPGAGVVDDDDPALLGSLLAGDDDPLVVPVRVTWLPPERDGARQVLARDLLLLTNPRRPWSRLQASIARRQPDRVRVTAGQPASASDLRDRFAAQAAATGPEALGEFAARQATIACDRADRAIIGDRYKVPRLVAEQITAGQRFRERVADLARELGRPVDEVFADAETCLAELATVQSPLAIDVYRAVMRPMHARTWTVEADSAGLERLRELNRRHALVFLPTHRSYMDPLVLQDVLHEHDFPRNHLLGGDNMAFWPIGPLGKRAGLIFIRRNFGADPIYKLAVREFLGHLVAKRFNLEWYLEGGRTRTGKLRPPKLGLLRYLSAAIEDERADDVVLVPTSIVYDRLPEVGSLTAEHAGAKKRAEGLRWMADYIRVQRRNVGVARVTFGEPLSLRDTLSEAGPGRAQLEKVAFRICDGINRVAPITSTSLVALALLAVRDRALTLAEIARVAKPLLDHLERRGVLGPLEQLRHEAGLRSGLDGLVEAGAATVYSGGTEPVWSIAPGGHQEAAYYRNGALHHFITRAIVELALPAAARSTEDGDPLEAAFDEALRLRDLLKFEFFFADRDRFRDEFVAELELVDPAWRERLGSPREALSVLAESGLLIADRALRSFIEAQVAVAEQLVIRDPRSAIDQDAFLQKCHGVGRQLVLQGRLHSAESVSRELFRAALELAANRGLLEPDGEEVRDARQRWLDEIRDVLERLRLIEHLNATMLEETLDGIAR
jgi:glycerol-3-phosphate O-acyltransferase